MRRAALRAGPYSPSPPRFFYFTLTYTSIFLALLPWLGCSHVFACPATAPADGSMVSISELIHREPLATAYAYFGGLFLFAVVYCQSDSQKNNDVSVVRFVMSFIAAKLLAVPLMLPLGSIPDSNVHDLCVLLGGVMETGVAIVVLVEKRKSHPTMRLGDKLHLLTTASMGTAVLAGGLIGYNVPQNAGVYALLSMEYLFGMSLAFNAFITHRFQF